jgi:hypothetical protein
MPCLRPITPSKDKMDIEEAFNSPFIRLLLEEVMLAWFLIHFIILSWSSDGV